MADEKNKKNEESEKSEEKTQSMKKVITGIHDVAKLRDAQQLRGKVKVVTSADILNIIGEIVESHAGQTPKELLTDLAQSELELVKLRHSIENLRKELEGAKEESLGKDAVVEEHAKKLNKALEAAEQRESEVSQLSEMVRASDEEHTAQIEKLQAFLEETKKNPLLQVDPAEVKALREEVSSLQTELRMSEDIEEMQRTEIANLEKQLENTRARYESQIKKLSSKIDQLEKELRRSREVERKLRVGLAEAAQPAVQKAKLAGLFGNVAVRLGYCTSAQVEEALKIQKDVAEMGLAPPRIGDVLVDKGHLSREQAGRVFRAQTAGRPRVEGYELISKLGEGLLGDTYRARQLSLDREVAIKIIRPEFASDGEYTAQFMGQAKHAGKLHHKNIARVIDAGESGGTLYCICEFVRGQNLRDVLRKKKKIGERQVLHVGLQVAAALVEAHQNGLVHGDIKPSNIIVNTEGVTKLCDFGLVKLINLHSEFALPFELFEGTYYAPPEVVRGGKPDERSDIYALGATLFSLATGHYPFGKARTPREALLSHLDTKLPDPRDKNPELSAGLSQVVMRMLEPEPGDRYQKPAEVVSAITEVVKRGKKTDSLRRPVPRRHVRRRRN